MSVNLLQVTLRLEGSSFTVGRLAWKQGRCFFEYDESFLSTGLELSPFHLPLQSGVHQSDRSPFEGGLFGLFNDSLPDGWGRLLLDRALQRKGMNPQAFHPLDRLSLVGQTGMGALCYEPDDSQALPETLPPLSELAKESQAVLQGQSSEVLNELLALNSASAGARPKVIVALSSDKQQILPAHRKKQDDTSRWLVKFPALHDSLDSGAVEMAYSDMARGAGLEMAPTHWFEADTPAGGFFGTQCFDENQAGRCHIHSASGLLHADHRYPSLDYNQLMRATWQVTRSHPEVKKLFRLISFNVLAHNRDDHSKNSSFRMTATGEWLLAPAYDLTFSSGPGGEHCMLINGEGRQPGFSHLRALGKAFSLTKNELESILEEVHDSIHRWPEWASPYPVHKETVQTINKRLKAIQ